MDAGTSTTAAMSIAEAIERGGITFTLAMCIMAAGWLFLQERRKNERLNSEIMKNNKDMIEALLSVKLAVDGFRETLTTLKSYICDRGGKQR